MGQDPSTIRQDIEETRERMGDTVDALAYKSDVKARAKDSVSERVGAIKGTITGAAHSVSDSAPDTEDLQHGAQRAAGIAQENPMGLAIGAAAVGFLAGMLIPSTSLENRKLGPVADQVKEHAKDAAQTVVEEGGEAARDAAQAALSAARETGMQHAEEVKDDLQREVQDTRDDVRGTAGTQPPL
jgi:gas vesicle protein